MLGFRNRMSKPFADPSREIFVGKALQTLRGYASAPSGEQPHGPTPALAQPVALDSLLSRLLLDPVLNPALRRRLRQRRTLWLLRCQQRRRSVGLPRSLAQLGGSDPRRGRPLDQPGLLSALQHRGPFWWYTSTLLQGEETSQQLLRTLLLQQQLWRRLKRLKQQRRRLKRRQPRWQRRALPSPRESDKLGVRRLERPLRRSRRRHQLKAQENLGRLYRPQELEQLTSRLVAVLQPKIRRHRKRLERAQQRRHSAGQRLLHWLRGGTLPRRRGSLGAVRALSKRLGGHNNPLQRQRLAQQQRREQRQEQLKLQKTQRWLLKKQQEATLSKEKHRREAEYQRKQHGTLGYAAGEAPSEGENHSTEPSEENSGSSAPSKQPSPEELRLKQQDKRSENRAYAQLSARLAALEKAVLAPLKRGQQPLPPQRLRETAFRLKQRQHWLRHQLVQMHRRLRKQRDPEGRRLRLHPRQPLTSNLRRLLAGQTRRWRRRLARRLRS